MLGSLPLSSTPEGFKQQVASDIKRWTRIVADAGIRPAAPATAAHSPASSGERPAKAEAMLSLLDPRGIEGCAPTPAPSPGSR